MLKIGIVGMGNIGNKHAQCYQKNKSTNIVAVCDIDKEKADKAAKAYKARVFYSVKEMLASGIKLDACSMTTAGEENGGDHYKPTMELLNAGIPVLGEKPISNKIFEAKKMVALAKKKKIPYGIDLNHRFTPSYITAKKWIDKGRLGEINIVNLTMWINNKNDTRPHFHMRALHPHSFDILRYYCGDVKRVQAFFKKGEGRKIWSNVQVNLQYKNGIIGHLTGSYDAGRGYGLETFEIVGSKGRVVVNEACEKLTFYPRETNEVETYEHMGGLQGFTDTFQTRIDAWINQLKKNVKPDKIDAKAEDALKAQLVIEAAIKSWETGKIISVGGIK